MTDRPNVLLVVTDQQRVDTLGFRNETPCRTPRIDEIAADGISFDRAITPCPLCTPSRSAVLTGLYPTQNDMMDNSSGQLTSCQLFDVFRAAGYQVNYAGKWHLGEGNIAEFTDRHAGDSTATYSAWCLDQGLVDGWMFNDPKTRTHRSPSMSIPTVHRQELPVDKTNEAYIADFAVDMIRTRDRGAPFFQVCSFNGPHPPFMIPEPYFSMYDPAIVTRPPNFGPQAGEPDAVHGSYYRRLFEDHGADFHAWKASYAVYWGFVGMVDAMVGRVIDALDDENLMDDTIIVFISDHGENLGAHGLWQKMVAYEESLRVPFLLRVPGSGLSGVRSELPASLIDLAPTVAALCGIDPLPEWSGADLLRCAGSGRAAPGDGRSLFAMHKPLGEWMNATDWRMIQQGRLKYIWNRDDLDELYDLETDPYECRNRVDDPQRLSELDSLQFGLSAFLDSIGDPLAGELRAAIGR